MISSVLIVQEDSTDYVNPLQRTNSRFEFSNGNTYPAVALPFDMTAWAPQTGKHGSGWVYT